MRIKLDIYVFIVLFHLMTILFYFCFLPDSSNKNNNKITELRAILQRESQNS